MELAFFFSHTSPGHNAFHWPGLEPGSSNSKPSALTTGLLNKAMVLACPWYSWPHMLKVAPCAVIRLYVHPNFLAWWVTTTLYNYGATLCELHYNESNIRCWYFEHHPFVICSDEGPIFKMSALKSLGWPIYIINKVNITKWS